MSDTVNVQWDQPLEAVHTDGRVIPVQQSGSDGCFVTPDLEGGWFSFREDGTHYVSVCPWRIRNVAQTTRTTDEQLTHYAERCKALVERMAKYGSCDPDGHSYDEDARAIVASMVEVDPDLIAAREVGAACGKESGNLQIIMDPDCWLSGRNDNTHKMQIALAAIRRGRALERGE